MIALGFERVVFHGIAVVRFRTCRITGGGGGSARKNCCIVCLLHERWDRKRRRWLMAGGGGGGIILLFLALDFGGSLISTAMVGLGPPLATTLFGHQKSRHSHHLHVRARDLVVVIDDDDDDDDDDVEPVIPLLSSRMSMR